jgi:hypothetical protein
VRVYLFDASAIANLVKRGSLKPLSEGVTLDPAAYEALNAVWKRAPASPPRLGALPPLTGGSLLARLAAGSPVTGWPARWAPSGDRAAMAAGYLYGLMVDLNAPLWLGSLYVIATQAASLALLLYVVKTR